MNLKSIMVFVILSLFSSMLATQTLETPDLHYICRDRLGYFYKEHFGVTACSMCYFYIIKDSPQFTLNKPMRFKTLHSSPYHLVPSISDTQQRVELFPTHDNRTSMNKVCETLNESACSRWKSCCRTAWDCCQLQIRTPPPSDVRSANHCPQTFDGWRCWNYTKAGNMVTQACPNFLIKSQVSGQCVKHCDDDGHWLKDNTTGLEYTNYDSCTQTDDNHLYKTTLFVGIALNAVGIILVVPAIFIFLLNRGLRKQLRIQIHINFFLSILLTACFCLTWDVIVRLDRVSSSKQQSTLYNQQVLCKSLHVLHKLARCTTFFWMTCEGYFLHRLMVNAFLPPKHVYGYLIFGWALPSVLFIIYGVIRKIAADDSVCWLLPLEGATKSLEWVLVYTPTMLCILINMIFLFNIVRQFLTKMVTHPNEPSTFRKALRATFILIPLFGLHQVCLIYRPTPDKITEFYIYEFISVIILNSQGIVISLVFCYFNNEVQGYIRKGVSRIKLRYYIASQQLDNRKMSVSTKSDSRKTSVSSLPIQTTQHLQCDNDTDGISNGGVSITEKQEMTTL